MPLKFLQISSKRAAGNTLRTTTGRCESSPTVPGPANTFDSTDLNTLQTALRTAVEKEDYAAAAKIRNRIRELGGGSNQKDWLELGLPEWLADRAERCGYRFPTAVQAEAAEQLYKGSDVLIQAQTGSGKTLAFLLPCLAKLDAALQQVTFLRRTESAGMMQPLAMILVPTRELGAQIALLSWRMLGGNLSSKNPGDEANMFTYQGPRDVRVVGILDEKDVERCRGDVEGGGLLEGVQIIVATPTFAAQAFRNGDLFPEMLQFIAVDELDLCIEQDDVAVTELLSIPERANTVRQVALSGATLPAGIFERCVEQNWMVNQPVLVGNVPAAGTIGPSLVPSSLSHRVVSVPESRKLVALCRLLRQDLSERGEDAVKTDTRVVVFAETEDQALEAAAPLRRSLWQQHEIVVCISGGYEPLKILEDFRDGRATLLIATANAARGLDLRCVSHVYSLGPPRDLAEYVHRAGRTGRIGGDLDGGVESYPRRQDPLSPSRRAAWLTRAQVLDVLFRACRSAFPVRRVASGCVAQGLQERLPGTTRGQWMCCSGLAGAPSFLARRVASGCVAQGLQERLPGTTRGQWT
ncbi:hypothetical protein CYMTET_11941, partial [Cymbomonas tetramitiformis]